MATRRENVRLSYHSNLAQGLARDAAAAQLLSRELSGLHRRAGNLNSRLPSLTQNVNGLGRALGGVGGNSGLNGSFRQGSNSLNQYTGRLRLLGQAIATIGPAAIPIGAVAVPAITGLASQLGFAAAAGGTAILAFQGVGEALDTLNKARLNPTTENLEAARIAMEKLSPAAQKFVEQLRSMADVGKQLRFSAQEGIFPGLTQALDTIESRVPEVERILFTLGDTVGDLFAMGAGNLAGSEWDEFFTFLETDARESLTGLGVAVGNTVHALGELWMAFDPLNDDFTNWMVDASRALDDWASGLAQTEGFSEFVAYIRDNGPQVAATFKAIATAALDIVQAAAPLGGPVLQAIEGIASAISLIADSDMGTPILTALAALTLFNRYMAVQSRLAATTWGRNITGANGFVTAMTTMRRTALLGGAAVAALAVAQTDAGKSALTSNTAMLALAGTMIGGPWGAAVGAGVGLTMDLAAANDDLESAVNRAKLSMEQGAGPDVLRRDLAALNQELEKTEDRLTFDKPNFLESFLPSSNALNLKAGLEAAAGHVENFFTGFISDAEETKRSLEEALAGGAGAAELLLGPLGMTKGAIDAATQSAEEFAASLTRVNELLSGRAGWRAYEQAIDDAAAALKENGRNLDINTQKGRDNQATLDAMATEALTLAENLKGMGRVRFLDRAREDFVKAATGFGMTEKAARKLADQLNLFPKEVSTKVDADTGTAEQKLAHVKAALDRYGLTRAEAQAALNDVASGRITSVQKLIDKYGVTKAQAQALLRDQASGVLANISSMLSALNGRTATTYVITRHQSVGSPAGTAANPTLNAFGGMYQNGVRTYARGGMDHANRHQPEMARPTLRIWAEPETRGESYIPWANDSRRPRAKRVLERTAGMFGGQVQWFANGGMTPAERGFNIGTLSTAETRSELREFARAVREAGGHLDQSFGRLSRRAIALSRQYEKSQATLEALRGRAADVRGAARSAFDNDPFGGSLADFRMQVDADRNDARATTAALRKAGRRGLNGPLAEFLAGSGNRALAEQFAGLSRAEIAREERRFAQRTAAQNALGSAAVDVSGLSASIERQVRSQDRLNKRLNNLEQRIENAVRKGAREGTDGTRRRQNQLVAQAVQGGGRR